MLETCLAIHLLGVNNALDLVAETMSNLYTVSLKDDESFQRLFNDFQHSAAAKVLCRRDCVSLRGWCVR